MLPPPVAAAAPSLAVLPPSLTPLIVRWVHALAMATIVGGALLCWGLFRQGVTYEMPAAYALRVAATYEWLFWAAGGVIVLTGVGNLGALAPGIPAVGSAWGIAFTVKLVAVIVLLLGSIVRTLGVVGLRRVPGTPVGEVVIHLRNGYAATAILLLGIVALAEVLAHG